MLSYDVNDLEKEIIDTDTFIELKKEILSDKDDLLIQTISHYLKLYKTQYFKYLNSLKTNFYTIFLVEYYKDEINKSDFLNYPDFVYDLRTDLDGTNDWETIESNFNNAIKEFITEIYDDLYEKLPVLIDFDKIKTSFKEFIKNKDVEIRLDSLLAINKIVSELGNYGADIEKYSTTLISDSYFEEYIEDSMNDVYSESFKELPAFITNSIDWSSVAKELESDYSTIELFNKTYYYVRY